MPPTPESVRSRSRTASGPEPLRRSRIPATAPASPLWRKALTYILCFATVVLLVDALVGERGLVSTMRARNQAQELTTKVESLRRENRQLRESARLLREDRTTIEALARKELGLIRPGEVLVVVRDVKPATR